MVEVNIGGDMAVEIECNLSFLEIPDDIIQIDNNIYPYTSGGTWVGNIYWNCYRVADEDMLTLINRLKSLPHITLIEAWSDLYEKWDTDEDFTIDDFKKAAV